ncbi:MAG: hypothetical protein PVF66_06860 [Candidatus Aminicenantes bacterium]|jgi:hypothetical protein
MPPYLEWFKCFGDSWGDLLEINLDHRHFNGMKGVYVIWCGEDKPKVLKVGQGVIRERLSENKEDPVLTKYSQHGLYVTWTIVPESDSDGIERFLGEMLKPLIGSRLPDAQPVEVNLPWEESLIFARKWR